MAIKHKLHKTKKSTVTRFSNDTKRQRLLLFVIGFAIIGSIILVATHAASPSVSLEAENGTIAGPAAKCGTDSTASNSNCVQFKKASATQTTNCAPNPHLCGFPDATNTGIPAGVTLTQVPSQATSGTGWNCVGTNCSGGVRITGNVGDAAHGIEIADGIGVVVPASSSSTPATQNVTIRNLKIDGIHGNSSQGLTICGQSDNANGPPGCSAWIGGTAANHIDIENCDIAGSTTPETTQQDVNRGWAAIYIEHRASSITVNKCNLHGFSGPIDMLAEAGNMVFTNNYIHHIVCWNYFDNNNNCPQGAAKGGDHCNNWGVGDSPTNPGTDSTLIQNNTMWMDNGGCASDVMAIFNDGGPQANIRTVMDHNLISGAGYCINPGYGDAYSAAGVPSYIAVTNNHLSTKFGTNCGGYGWSYLLPVNSTYGPGGCTTGTSPKCGGGAGAYNCQNVWDDGPFAGSGADVDNYYPTKTQALTTCPSPLPWTIPNWTSANSS